MFKNLMLAQLCVASIVCLMAGSTAAAKAPYQLTGHFTQGGLLVGKTQPGARVSQDGHPLRVSESGDFLLGFGRDAKNTSTLKVVLASGEVFDETLKVAARDYKIQRIDGLPRSKVSPRKPELIQRIRKERATIAAARKTNAPRVDFLSGFVWPVKGRLSGVYGSQRILNGKPRRPHFGLDIAAPVGTPLLAPADGRITLAYPDMFLNGSIILLDHGHGLVSAFLHLHKLHVEAGQQVKQGQLIAEVGKSGRVTGPHLHWQIYLHKQMIDPQLLLPVMQE